MSQKNRPYLGKDGNRYSDYYEMKGADTRYEQQQKLIEEKQNGNRLMKEQNERIKNGGMTNSEIITENIVQIALAYVMKKNYESEISINLTATIIIMYPTALLICFALVMNDQYKKYIPFVILGTIILHIYFKICITLMERSFKKNKRKKTKHKGKQKNVSTKK